jgi:DNA-binding transcriptional MerR regulator
MAEQTSEPKKRGRKKGSVNAPKTASATSTKRIPNIQKLSFEQLQQLSNTINELMKNKKDEQIKILKQKLAELENM